MNVEAWEPGSEGKGAIYGTMDNPGVATWKTVNGDPHHYAVMPAEGIFNFMPFEIEPDGSVEVLYGDKQWAYKLLADKGFKTPTGEAGWDFTSHKLSEAPGEPPEGFEWPGATEPLPEDSEGLRTPENGSEPAYNHPKYRTDLAQHLRGRVRWGLPRPFKSGRRAGADPEWLQRWIAANGPYVMHEVNGRGETAEEQKASAQAALQAIRRDGLIPHDRGPGSVYSGALVPRSNHVYLAGANAGLHQALGRDPETGQPRDVTEMGTPYVAIDLRKLDPDKLHADEDAFSDWKSQQRFGLPRAATEHYNVGHKPYMGAEPGDPLEHIYQPNQDGNEAMQFPHWGAWADHHKLDEPHHLAHSLNTYKTLAYEGGVHPEAFVDPHAAAEDLRTNWPHTYYKPSWGTLGDSYRFKADEVPYDYQPTGRVQTHPTDIVTPHEPASELPDSAFEDDNPYSPEEQAWWDKEQGKAASNAAQIRSAQHGDRGVSRRHAGEGGARSRAGQRSLDRGLVQVLRSKRAGRQSGSVATRRSAQAPGNHVGGLGDHIEHFNRLGLGDIPNPYDDEHPYLKPWEPGTYGKATVLPNGLIAAWKTGYGGDGPPTHMQVMRDADLVGQDVERWQTPSNSRDTGGLQHFVIDKDGSVQPVMTDTYEHNTNDERTNQAGDYLARSLRGGSGRYEDFDGWDFDADDEWGSDEHMSRVARGGAPIIMHPSGQAYIGQPGEAHIQVAQRHNLPNEWHTWEKGIGNADGSVDWLTGNNDEWDFTGKTAAPWNRNKQYQQRVQQMREEQSYDRFKWIMDAAQYHGVHPDELQLQPYTGQHPFERLSPTPTANPYSYNQVQRWAPDQLDRFHKRYQDEAYQRYMSDPSSPYFDYENFVDWYGTHHPEHLGKQAALPFTDFEPGFYHIAPTSERARIQLESLRKGHTAGAWDFNHDTSSRPVIKLPDNSLIMGQPGGLHVAVAYQHGLPDEWYKYPKGHVDDTGEITWLGRLHLGPPDHINNYNVKEGKTSEWDTQPNAPQWGHRSTPFLDVDGERYMGQPGGLHVDVIKQHGLDRDTVMRAQYGLRHPDGTAQYISTGKERMSLEPDLYPPEWVHDDDGWDFTSSRTARLGKGINWFTDPKDAGDYIDPLTYEQATLQTCPACGHYGPMVDICPVCGHELAEQSSGGSQDSAVIPGSFLQAHPDDAGMSLTSGWDFTEMPDLTHKGVVMHDGTVHVWPHSGLSHFQHLRDSGVKSTDVAHYMEAYADGTVGNVGPGYIPSNTISRAQSVELMRDHLDRNSWLASRHSHSARTQDDTVTRHPSAALALATVSPSRTHAASGPCARELASFLRTSQAQEPGTETLQGIGQGVEHTQQAQGLRWTATSVRDTAHTSPGHAHSSVRDAQAQSRPSWKEFLSRSGIRESAEIAVTDPQSSYYNSGQNWLWDSAQGVREGAESLREVRSPRKPQTRRGTVSSRRNSAINYGPFQVPEGFLPPVEGQPWKGLSLENGDRYHWAIDPEGEYPHHGELLLNLGARVRAQKYHYGPTFPRDLFDEPFSGENWKFAVNWPSEWGNQPQWHKDEQPEPGEDWQRGYPGKAVVFKDGDVWAWTTDEKGSPHHWDQVASPTLKTKIRSYHDIHPDGRVVYAGPDASAPDSELVANYIGGTPAGSYWDFTGRVAAAPQLVDMSDAWNEDEEGDHGTGDHPVIWFPNHGLVYKGPFDAYHSDMYDGIPQRIVNEEPDPFHGRFDPGENHVEFYQLPKELEPHMEGVRQALGADSISHSMWLGGEPETENWDFTSAWTPAPTEGPFDHSHPRAYYDADLTGQYAQEPLELEEAITRYKRDFWNNAEGVSPEEVEGLCTQYAGELAQYLNAHGIEAEVIGVGHPHELGYPPATRTPDPSSGNGHSVVKIKSTGETIDFTAAQYGYKQFPMRVKTGGWEQDANEPPFAEGVDAWEPGKRGKGLVSPEGRAYTWQTTGDWDGPPSHAQALESLGGPEFQHALDGGWSFFDVHSDGTHEMLVGNHAHKQIMDAHLPQEPRCAGCGSVVNPDAEGAYSCPSCKWQGDYDRAHDTWNFTSAYHGPLQVIGEENYGPVLYFPGSGHIYCAGVVTHNDYYTRNMIQEDDLGYTNYKLYAGTRGLEQLGWGEPIEELPEVAAKLGVPVKEKNPGHWDFSAKTADADSDYLQRKIEQYVRATGVQPSFEQIKEWTLGEPGYYYHYAPTHDRHRIMQHGLQPSAPAWSGWWDDAEKGSNPAGWIRRQPTGVYVTEDDSKFGPGNFEGPMDLWRIPREQVRRKVSDPLVSGAWVIQHPVQPELHKPYEQTGRSEWDWAEAQAARSLDYYAEPTDQERKDWMIGRPTPKVRWRPSSVRDTVWEFESAVHDDSSADAWTTCDQGHTHWGTAGAAGLLLQHVDPQGTTRYLLQHRSPWVQHGNTWSTPGGALMPGESPAEGAHRETVEELGDLPEWDHLGTDTDDHGGWAYHTVHGRVTNQFAPIHEEYESADHGWFTKDEINKLPLHPGFAAYWDQHNARMAKVAQEQWEYARPRTEEHEGFKFEADMRDSAFDLSTLPIPEGNSGGVVLKDGTVHTWRNDSPDITHVNELRKRGLTPDDVHTFLGYNQYEGKWQDLNNYTDAYHELFKMGANNVDNWVYRELPESEGREDNADIFYGRVPVLYQPGWEHWKDIPGAEHVKPNFPHLYVGAPNMTHAEAEQRLGIIKGGIAPERGEYDPQTNTFNWLSRWDPEPKGTEQVIERLRARFPNMVYRPPSGAEGWNFQGSETKRVIPREWELDPEAVEEPSPAPHEADDRAEPDDQPVIESAPSVESDAQNSGEEHEAHQTSVAHDDMLRLIASLTNRPPRELIVERDSDGRISKIKEA